MYIFVKNAFAKNPTKIQNGKYIKGEINVHVAMRANDQTKVIAKNKPLKSNEWLQKTKQN